MTELKSAVDRKPGYYRVNVKYLAQQDLDDPHSTVPVINHRVIEALSAQHAVQQFEDGRFKVYGQVVHVSAQLMDAVEFIRISAVDMDELKKLIEVGKGFAERESCICSLDQKNALLKIVEMVELGLEEPAHEYYVKSSAT